jgi:hypothetical protein
MSSLSLNKSCENLLSSQCNNFPSCGNLFQSLSTVQLDRESRHKRRNELKQHDELLSRVRVNEIELSRVRDANESFSRAAENY